MPRNMIDANAGLFYKLAVAGGDLISQDLREQKRAIRTNPTEKGWLKGLDVRSPSHLILDSVSRFALGEYGGCFYLIAVGVDVVNPPAELEPVELNAGMFTAIAHEINVPFVRTADLAERLLEYVFYPVEKECELIDVEVVASFFQKICVFRVDPESAVASDIKFGLRAAIAAVLGAPAARSLEWPSTAIDRFNFMVRDPNECAPFHLLLRALTDTRDDAAFLALYRCIEQLFPIPAIGNLSSELGLSGPALRVAATIEKHLGWRRREEDAIAQLFGELDSRLVERIIPVVGAVVQNENRPKIVSKRIYEIRNQCVHFRPAHAVGEVLTIDNWPALIDLMLEAVQYLYGKYSGSFVEHEVVSV